MPTTPSTLMARWRQSPRALQLAALAASAAVVVFAYTLCSRSISLADEGHVLGGALEIAQGKVLYRDIDSFVAPGIWLLLAGVFKLFQPSVLTSRLLAFVGYLATVWICYRIVAMLSGRAWAWATVAGLLVFTVWAFPAWTFCFYSPYAVMLALAGLERLLRWQSRRRAATPSKGV